MRERMPNEGPHGVRLAAHNGRLRRGDIDELIVLADQWEQERADNAALLLSEKAAVQRMNEAEDAMARMMERIRLLESAYGLLWTFDIAPTFDAKARYTDRKAQEWKHLLDEANAIAPRPAPAPDGSGGASQIEVPGGHEATNASGPHSVGYE